MSRDAIIAMPKVELHVHLEGAITPETLLGLARRHGITLPASDAAQLRAWCRFTDFAHFVKVYLAISDCLRSAEDIELVARDFLAQQAAQHVVYTEFTYTAYTHWYFKQMPFDAQLAALNRARAWAAQTLGVSSGIVLDIPRIITPDKALLIADWAISAMHDGVVALGLGGSEAGNPPARYAAAFERARAAGLPAVPHAGETAGPESIRGALALGAVRLGHGVRCVEDAALVEELRAAQTMLEVCPTSNVCLGVVPRYEDHPLPRLLAAGLNVCVNSDDPALFGRSLTEELIACHERLSLSVETLRRLQRRAAEAALLSRADRDRLLGQLG